MADQAAPITEQKPAAPIENIKETLDKEDDNYYASGLFDIEASPAFKALDLLRDRPDTTEERYKYLIAALIGIKRNLYLYTTTSSLSMRIKRN